MALSPSSMSGPAVTGRTSFEDFICVTCMHTFFSGVMKIPNPGAASLPSMALDSRRETLSTFQNQTRQFS